MLPFAFCARSRCLSLFIITFVHFLSLPLLFRALNKFRANDCWSVFVCVRKVQSVNEEFEYAIVTSTAYSLLRGTNALNEKNMRLILMPYSRCFRRPPNENNV